MACVDRKTLNRAKEAVANAADDVEYYMGSGRGAAAEHRWQRAVDRLERLKSRRVCTHRTSGRSRSAAARRAAARRRRR